MPYKKFFIFLLIIAVSFMLQVWHAALLGWQVNFLFAALVTLTFFMRLEEFIFFALLSVLLLNWQPAFSREMALFILLPRAFLFLDQYAPWKKWCTNAIAIGLGLFLIYAVTIGMRMFDHHAILVEDIALSTVFGALLFSILHPLYEPPRPPHKMGNITFLFS